MVKEGEKKRERARRIERERVEEGEARRWGEGDAKLPLLVLGAFFRWHWGRAWPSFTCHSATSLFVSMLRVTALQPPYDN